MHLPRSVFSRKQLDLFLWLLRANHVDSVPSTKNMTTLNKALQGICGIETIPYDGRLGNRYYVNNLSQILAQVSLSLDAFVSEYYSRNSNLANRKCAIPKSDQSCTFTLKKRIHICVRLDRQIDGLSKFVPKTPHP